MENLKIQTDPLPGIGVGGFFLGVYATYLMVAWVYREEDEKPKITIYDENSYH